MGPLVSVIILPFEDDIYLERCINSIKRQTYKNVDIFVMNSLENSKKKFDNCTYIIGDNVAWLAMDKVINQTKGQFLFFCDVNMVLEPCLLDRVVPTADDKMVIVNSKTVKGKQLVNLDNTLFTIAGKMFDKNVITQNQIHFNADEVCPERLFMAEYMCHCKQIEERKDVYLYGLNKQLVFNQVSNLDSETVKVYIEKVAKGCWSSSQKEKLIVTFLYQLFDNIETQENGRKVIVESAITVVRQFKNNPAVIYDFSNKHLKPLFVQVMDENNNELWEVFQVFFAEIDNTDLQKVLCTLFDIDETKYELLFKYSLNEFKFYSDKLPCKKENADNINESQLLSEVLKIKDLVIKAEPKQVVTRCEKEIIYQPVSLQGYELGMCFVNECAAGKMGLKFIVKAAISWMKYKIRRK